MEKPGRPATHARPKSFNTDHGQPIRERTPHTTRLGGSRLSGKADSGVFITTSRFSDGARTYAANVPTRIILIDGERLTSLMIRYGVGVQVRETFRVVEIDEDFFA